MTRVVIGTAGHVDHGKTALVRALTGIDTDRLEEEKRRGITIELGFAHLALRGAGEGAVAGVVDVPGHERFVKAMAAGAGGVDLALLVVAADEGVMPQTREHVDICELLGVRQGVVAVTKSDLLPGLGAEWTRLLRADVAALVAGTFLERAPVVLVSAQTGSGLPELVETLGALSTQVPERPVDGPVYLPIDRAFTLKGFGTVVTGTLLSGSLAAGQEVDLLPGGPRAVRLRGLQVHGREAAAALAGQRTAANLLGVDAAEVTRGMVLAAAGALEPTALLDVELSNLRSSERPLRLRQKLLCHLGTAAVPCTVVLLDREQVEPGQRAFAQLRLAKPIVALPRQRFILRGFAQRGNRGRTVAGGAVLAVGPRRRRPGRPEAADGLAVLRDGPPAERLAWLLEDAGPRGLTEAALARLTASPSREVAAQLARLGEQGRAVLFDPVGRAYVGRACFDELADRAAALIAEHHRANPVAPGAPKEELRQRLAPDLDPHLFQQLLGSLSSARRAVVQGEHVSLAGHERSVRGTGVEARERLAAALGAGGLSPPTLGELAREAGLPAEQAVALLKMLVAEGLAVKVKEDLYFSAAAVGALRERLRAHLTTRGEITTPEFKALTGATRKFTIPLGELFDREKLTLRLGDKRVLRGASAEAAKTQGAGR